MLVNRFEVLGLREGRQRISGAFECLFAVTPWELGRGCCAWQRLVLFSHLERVPGEKRCLSGRATMPAVQCVALSRPERWSVVNGL